MPFPLAISFIIALVLLEILLSIIFFYPKSISLQIGKKGFTLCMIFRKRFFRWTEVSEFRVRRILFLKLIVFDVPPHSLFSGRCLLDTYGMKVENLADLLNRRKEIAIAQPSNPADGKAAVEKMGKNGEKMGSDNI